MKQYSLLKDNQNLGPMTPEQLVQNGLNPNSMVWAEGMPQWVPASQVPELAPYLAAAQPQYQQPYQQPAPQPQYQQPYQQPAQMNPQTIFKYILYAVLAFTAIAGLITFIGSFGFFKSEYKALKPVGTGIFQLFTGIMMIVISVAILIRLIKNGRFAFLSLMFFGITFLFGLLNMIIIGSALPFIFMLIAGILGCACTIFAAIPMDKLGDPNSFSQLFAQRSSADFILLGIYVAFLIALLIFGLGKGPKLMYEHYSDI